MTIKIWFYVMRAFGPVAAFMLLVGTIYAALYPLRNLVEKLLRHIQHKPDNNQ